MLQDQVDGPLRKRHLWITQSNLPIERSKTRCDQKVIPLAKRHIESAGKPQDHVPTRIRATALNETKVAGRNTGIEGQIELTLPSHLAPMSE